MEERDHPVFGAFHDSLFELDKWIEEHVYGRPEPIVCEDDPGDPCPDCDGTGQVLPAASWGRSCPCPTCEGSGVIFPSPPLLIGWEDLEDGRYCYWDYHYEGRSYYASDFWPRRFSTNTMLSVELVKKFRISLKPVVNSRDAVVGYSVKSSLMPGISVVKETLEEAVCLLVVMLTKNTEVKSA